MRGTGDPLELFESYFFGTTTFGNRNFIELHIKSNSVKGVCMSTCQVCSEKGGNLICLLAFFQAGLFCVL